MKCRNAETLTDLTATVHPSILKCIIGSQIFIIPVNSVKLYTN